MKFGTQKKPTVEALQKKYFKAREKYQEVFAEHEKRVANEPGFIGSKAYKASLDRRLREQTAVTQAWVALRTAEAAGYEVDILTKEIRKR